MKINVFYCTVSDLDIDYLRVLDEFGLCQIPEDILLELRGIFVIVHDGHGDPEVSVQQLIQLEILIILPERIIQSLGNPQPAENE